MKLSGTAVIPIPPRSKKYTSSTGLFSYHFELLSVPQNVPRPTSALPPGFYTAQCSE